MMNYQRGSQVIIIIMIMIINLIYAKFRSMRGVRKEINYSEPCSNAPEKAQLNCVLSGAFEQDSE